MSKHILSHFVSAGLPYSSLQELHEVIRGHSVAAGKRIKEEGLSNDLLERIRADPAFSSVQGELDDILDAKNFIGRASEQVVDFLEGDVYPELEARKVDKSFTGEVKV